MQPFVSAIAPSLLLVVSSLCWVSETSAQDITDQDEASEELDKATQEFETAYNQHDAAAVARLYAEDADAMLIVGGQVKEQLKGRAEIEKSFTEFFAAHPNAKGRAKNISRRLLAPDVAVEDAIWEESSLSGEDPSKEVRYVVVMVRKNGKWLTAVERGIAPQEQQSASSEADGQAATDEVRQVAEQYERALRDEDVEALERILSEDYIFIDVVGAIKKKKDVLSDLESGNLKFEVAKSENSAFRTYGDTVVWNGEWIEQGVYDGEPFDKRERFTTVLVKINGNWQVVSDQVTEIQQQ